MRSSLKYITPLLMSGVIIAACKTYLNNKASKTVPVTNIAIARQATIRQEFHFSFLKDVASKLLPAAVFFQ